MKFFNSRPPEPPRRQMESTNGIPILQIDLSKRYDVYCSTAGDERLYEDVKFVCMRTFVPTLGPHPHMITDFLEIESADGSRSLIPEIRNRVDPRTRHPAGVQGSPAETEFLGLLTETKRQTGSDQRRKNGQEH